MRKVLLAASVLALTLAVAHPAQAQARFGTQISFASDDIGLGLGARVGFPIGAELKRKGIEALATFDYFFPKGDVNYWELTANGLYHFTSGSQVKPYVGGGVVYGHTSVSVSPGLSGSGSDVGLNLMGGLRFKAQDRLLPFVEARLELNDGSFFVIGGGVYFGKP